MVGIRQVMLQYRRNWITDCARETYHAHPGKTARLPKRHRQVPPDPWVGDTFPPYSVNRVDRALRRGGSVQKTFIRHAALGRINA